MKNLLKIAHKNKNLPVQAVCRNCGAALHGPYCSQCGQHLMSGVKRTIRDLTFNAVENMFVLDHKMFSSLVYLLFIPGKLTKEYMHGRIVSYMHPSKLFWFISFIFFTFLTIYINEERDKTKEKLYEKKIEALTETHEQSTDSLITKNSAKKETVDDLLEDEEYARKSEKFISAFNSYSPYAAFFMIPIFAVLVMLFFRRKENFYVDYLAFSMHFHAFIFILSTILLIVKYLYADLDIPWWLIFLPAIYFLRAAWVVYRPKAWGLLWRSFLIVILYGIAIIVFTVLFIINLGMMAKLF